MLKSVDQVATILYDRSVDTEQGYDTISIAWDAFLDKSNSPGETPNSSCPEVYTLCA